MKPAPSAPPVLSPLAILSILALTLGWFAVSQRGETDRVETAGIENLVPAGSKYTAAYSDPELNPDIIDSDGFRTEANSGVLSFLAENEPETEARAAKSAALTLQPAKIRKISPAGKAKPNPSDPETR